MTSVLRKRLFLLSKYGRVLSVPVIMLGVLGFTSVCIAGEDTSQQNADRLRASAQQKAQNSLGYDSVYRDPKNRQQDFRALADQISILSEIIEQMAEEQATAVSTPTGFMPKIDPTISADSALAMHGPKGPSVKSVQLIAEYQLLRHGYDRLKVGTITETEKAIEVDVTTADGSLVERYSVNKLNGLWTNVGN